MLEPTRPGLVSGLKRRLEREVERIDKAHQEMLLDVEAAFESRGFGV